MSKSIVTRIVADQFRLLSFRDVKIAVAADRSAYLVYIFLVTGVVGAGRYWDHPDAMVWQYWGFGSILYIVLLSGFLYLIVLPLRPKRWSYDMVLVFVGFTSLPALLYAIPVERYLVLEHAQKANAWFLGVVAFWRVALYVRFLVKGAGLSKFSTFIATLLPLSAIVGSLAALNLEHVVFSIMSGIQEEERSGNDIAYTVVFILSIFAYIALPITFVCYVIAIYRQRKGAAHSDI